MPAKPLKQTITIDKILSIIKHLEKEMVESFGLCYFDSNERFEVEQEILNAKIQTLDDIKDIINNCLD